MTPNNDRKPHPPQHFYALTQNDVQNIWAILATARDAIDELFDYRRVGAIDPAVDFPCENAFYERTSTVLRQADSDLENIF